MQPSNPKRGLGRFLDIRGSIDVRRALAKADANLNDIKSDAVALIDKGLARLAGVRTLGPEISEANLAGIYGDALQIANLAGTFGLSELGGAARLFCDHLDLVREKGGWDQSRARLHIEAMICLRSDGLSAGSGLVLEALRGLAAHDAAKQGCSNAAPIGASPPS